MKIKWMMARAIFFGAAAIACLGFAAENANAGIVTYTDRGVFDAAVGATTLEDFNSYTTDAQFSASPVDVGDFTLSIEGSNIVSLESNLVDASPFYNPSRTNVNGTTGLNVFTNGTSSLFFRFDSDMFAFGADFRAFNNGIRRTDVYVNGQQLMPDVVSGDVLSFFGFSSDTAFTSVEFRGAGQNDSFGIDDVAYRSTAIPPPGGGVPEPASFAIFGTLCLIAGAGRRRRKA